MRTELNGEKADPILPKGIIGIVGSEGDLGSQLRTMVLRSGFSVVSVTRQSTAEQLRKLAQKCDIIHICAPVSALEALPKTRAVIVLHDSVMATSFGAGKRYLGKRAGAVHMLMNDSNTVVVAKDMPHKQKLMEHFKRLGCRVVAMTRKDHDILMARTQAPLALLCQSLLPFLCIQGELGLLTPSGTVLTETLKSRELAWTDTTMSSILQNPQIKQLLTDIKRGSRV